MSGWLKTYREFQRIFETGIHANVQSQWSPNFVTRQLRQHYHLHPGKQDGDCSMVCTYLLFVIPQLLWWHCIRRNYRPIRPYVFVETMAKYTELLYNHLCQYVVEECNTDFLKLTGTNDSIISLHTAKRWIGTGLRQFRQDRAGSWRRCLFVARLRKPRPLIAVTQPSIIWTRYRASKLIFSSVVEFDVNWHYDRQFATLYSRLSYLWSIDCVGFIFFILTQFILCLFTWWAF